VHVQRSAVAAFPEDAPERSRCLANLAASLWIRYSSVGSRADLDEAIGIFTDVAAATPSGSPARAVRLNNLGLVLRERHALTGNDQDQDRARAAYRASCAAGATSDALWALQGA
jgi:hypothetical protein